jgi:hypothetical protein
LFIRATRAAFEGTGEALKFVETAIYTIPYILASQLGIHLMVFGEDGGYEYGSTVHENDAAVCIRNAGNSLLDNASWWSERGVTRAELGSIDPGLRAASRPKVVFMSHYKPWSSMEHLEIALARGFKTLDDTGEWRRQGTIEQFEQIDSVAYMVHLWLKYPKFGFQRAMDIASRRCREGLMTLDEVKQVAERVDPELDPWALDDFCSTLGYTKQEFWRIVEKLWNPDIFEKRGTNWVFK